MKPETFQDFMALSALVISVIGFAAIIIQLNQLERGLRSSARGSIYDMAARVKELFLKYPEMRSYFFDGDPIEPNHQDYNLAINIADYVCLYLEQITTQGESIQATSRKSWFRYARETYQNSPLLQQHLNGKENWYAPIFWDVLEGRVVE